MIQDPFQYIGRVIKRGEDGKVRSMEVIHPEDTVTLEDGDEFITFVTVIDLAAS